MEDATHKRPWWLPMIDRSIAMPAHVQESCRAIVDLPRLPCPPAQVHKLPQVSSYVKIWMVEMSTNQDQAFAGKFS
jgi:hypothetical protein